MVHITLILTNSVSVAIKCFRVDFSRPPTARSLRIVYSFLGSAVGWIEAEDPDGMSIIGLPWFLCRLLFHPVGGTQISKPQLSAPVPVFHYSRASIALKNIWWLSPYRIIELTSALFSPSGPHSFLFYDEMSFRCLRRMVRLHIPVINVSLVWREPIIEQWKWGYVLYHVPCEAEAFEWPRHSLVNLASFFFVIKRN